MDGGGNHAGGDRHGVSDFPESPMKFDPSATPGTRIVLDRKYIQVLVRAESRSGGFRTAETPKGSDQGGTLPPEKRVRIW